MMMRRVLRIILLFLAAHLSVYAQTQTTGTRDYALSGSSVMWLPRASALFLNPAELGRLHQAEVLISTNRFSSLSSFCASYFEPFVGTFAAGIANETMGTQYSLGYARILSQNTTMGGSLTVLRDGSEKFLTSFGGALHFPKSSIRNSGLHTGFSIVNLSNNTASPFVGLNLGVAYWVLPKAVRFQSGWRHEQTQSFLLGAEASLTTWLSLQAGTRSFETFSGGFSLHASYVTADLAAGPAGISFSLNLRISDAAVDLRDEYFELGQDAFDEERFPEAQEYFLTAAEFDENFMPARTLADRAIQVVDSTVDNLLRQGNAYQRRGNLLDALSAYSKIIKIEAGNAEAHRRIKEIQPKLHGYVDRLIASGDSLRNRKDFNGARRSYEQAMAIEPNNQSIAARLARIRTAVKDNSKSLLLRARWHLDRGRLDDAQKEYEQVLAINPKNRQAKAGLEAVRTRRIDELFEQGTSAFNENRYFDALKIFMEVQRRDGKHRDAKILLGQAREMLTPDIDKYFKAGLQFYSREEYKAALEEWDNALLIEPRHKGVLEYRKRAQQKLKALERLD